MLPDALLVFLNDSIPCREQQIRQLASLLDPSIPNLPVLVLYGLEATGKSLTSKAVLGAIGTPHAIVRSQECITSRHLLERTVAVCREALDWEGDAMPLPQFDGKCENTIALAGQLQELLEKRKRLTLVFDGIDHQRETSAFLLPALARLPELVRIGPRAEIQRTESLQIPNLTLIFIVTAPRPRFLCLTGAPHIHFPPYDRSQVLSILAQNPHTIYEPTNGDQDNIGFEYDEDDVWLWTKFCEAVWTSLGKGAARDVVNFRSICEKLWHPFVQPIRDGAYSPREFPKLLVRNKMLFQGDAALTASIMPIDPTQPRKSTTKHSHELPYFTKYLLISAYLASHNPSRLDQVYFMKAHSKKRRKKSHNTSTPGKPKHRKIQRRLLGPQAFVLERLMAIFHAIVPRKVQSGSADVMAQIATLASLRLIAKASGSADVLDAGSKWRVNVGWEYIRGLGKRVGCEVEDYLAE
ncbi:MAG: hypothetical protein MMC33_007313 [Icmadophila ericetorum]|nr:hypothetical protein [Icmadophila ericetorum]